MCSCAQWKVANIIVKNGILPTAFIAHLPIPTEADIRNVLNSIGDEMWLDVYEVLIMSILCWIKGRIKCHMCIIIGVHNVYFLEDSLTKSLVFVCRQWPNYYRMPKQTFRIWVWIYIMLCR